MCCQKNRNCEDLFPGRVTSDHLRTIDTGRCTKEATWAGECAFFHPRTVNAPCWEDGCRHFVLRRGSLNVITLGAPPTGRYGVTRQGRPSLMRLGHKQWALFFLFFPFFLFPFSFLSGGILSNPAKIQMNKKHIITENLSGSS